MPELGIISRQKIAAPADVAAASTMADNDKASAAGTPKA
jgi:hypothetical protein